MTNTTAPRRSAARSRPTPSRGRPVSRSRGRRPSRVTARRRRLFWFVTALLVGIVVLAVAMGPQLKQGIQELTLPLRHEDIIRQQARD